MAVADDKDDKPEVLDAEEKKFRRKNLWHSFTAAVYSALGGAAFIGALGTLANGLVKVAAGGTAGVEAASMFTAMPMLAIGGLIVAGVTCCFMAQKEYTELKCLGDDHLAKVTAKQREIQKAARVGMPPPVVVEHHDQCRKDGKQWKEAEEARIAARAAQPEAQAART